jgi:3-keto-disaccharide hydrolase
VQVMWQLVFFGARLLHSVSRRIEPFSTSTFCGSTWSKNGRNSTKWADNLGLGQALSSGIFKLFSLLLPRYNSGMKMLVPENHAFLFILLAVAPAVCAQSSSDGFVPIFDGATLKGWHASAKTGHSRASQHQSGGKWVIEEGAIVGSQDLPGNGGLLLTDEPFGDFEVVLEMKNDFGPDSGLFLRSTEDGTAYQAMIDYHANGNLMGIYGEGKLGAKPSVRNFNFTDKVTGIIVTTNSPMALPVLPESWPYFWRHGQWNELRARIVNNPPTITTWINGVKFMEWTETQKRHPDRGGIGLQVHGGGDLTKQFVRYRNIRVKKM